MLFFPIFNQLSYTFHILSWKSFLHFFLCSFWDSPTYFSVWSKFNHFSGPISLRLIFRARSLVSIHTFTKIRKTFASSKLGAFIHIFVQLCKSVSTLCKMGSVFWGQRKLKLFLAGYFDLEILLAFIFLQYLYLC